MTLKVRIYLATFFLLFTAVILGYLLSQLFRGILPLDLSSFVLTLLLGATVAILFNIVMRSAKRMRLLAEQAQSMVEPMPTQFQTPITVQSTPVRTVPSERSVAPQPPSPTIPSPPPRNETPPEIETQEKLLQMLKGDRAAAERLIAEAKSRYPGFSENWYWGKVIADLERDRY